MWEQEEGQERAENAERRRDEERVLTSTYAIRTARSMVLYDGEEVCADKSAYFSHGGSDGVILTSNGGGGCLGGDKTDVVARAELAEGEEDSVALN